MKRTYNIFTQSCAHTPTHAKESVIWKPFHILSLQSKGEFKCKKQQKQKQKQKQKQNKNKTFCLEYVVKIIPQYTGVKSINTIDVNNEF